MTPRVTSRLVRKQQQKVFAQTVLLGIAAVAVGLGFLFYILPNSVKVLNFLSGGTGADTTQDDKSGILPQTPQLAAPPQATSSAQISVTGFAQQNSDVMLLKNGEQAGQTSTDNDGKFAFDVQLDEGENRLSAFARNKTTNKESEPSQPFVVIKDTQAPKLEVTQPTDGQNFQLQKNQVITITGTTDSQSQITVNDRSAYVNDQGSFSLTYQLQDGDNKLTVISTDQAGNQTTKELTVHFSP